MYAYRCSMRERFLSLPVLLGGSVIAVVALMLGATRMGINPSIIFLFAIPFVFPAAVVHHRSVYLLVISIFLLTAWGMELYLKQPGTKFLLSSYQVWAPLIISAEVIYQISSARRRADMLSHRRALELEAMDLTMAELSSDINVQHVLLTIVERATKLLNASSGDLALYDPQRDDLEIVANHPLNKEQIGIHMKMGEGSMGLVAVTKQPSLVNNYKSWAHRLSLDFSIGVEAVLDVPLLKGDELIGVLGVGRHSKHKPFTDEDKAILNVFARQAIIAIQNAHLYKEIQSLAFTDSLTGINNRRRLFELAEKEFVRAQRYHRPLSFILMDVDHFKSINDHYGHAVGDIVLQWFAQECKKSIRENIDVIGRFGGEEFAILFPETDLETAVMVAQRLHTQLSGSTILALDHKLTVTFSAGVSSLQDQPNLTLDQLIDHADKALYKAKEYRDSLACWRDKEFMPLMLEKAK